MAVYTAIDDPEAYFQVKTYSGTGSSLVLTFDGDTDMQPDLIWGKADADGYNHGVVDSVRGVQKNIYPNLTEAEEDYSTGVTAFGSDGFTVGGGNVFNNSSYTYVAWCWKESATAGFDIVSYAGTGSAKTESHSLSAVPKLIIVKNRDAGDAWQVYHGANTSAPETDYLVLNTNAATADAADRWNDTAPTSSVFSLGDGDEVNTNTENYIAYCFAEKQGFSKFGSYTGNGNADGTFVYTGFKPAFVLLKNTASALNWNMQDIKRDPFNPVQGHLAPNNNAAEADSSSYYVDFLSNGFKIRNSLTVWNADGANIIYMAFAEAPFVNSNGVPCTSR